MTHLTDVQLTDAAEGRLDPEASAHLADCAVCTKSVDEMRAVLDSVASVSVPEPSPLFWEHFGTGVNAGIVEAPEPVRSWLPPGALAWLGAAAVILLSVIGYYATRPSFEAAPAAPAAALGEPPALLDAAPDDVEADEAWALMRSLAVDLHYDDARDAGVLPGPGSVERAATELSEAERAELVRLIQDELKRMGA